MTILYAIVRTIGLPACVVIALLAYYEGLPFLSDIPYADRIPVVRELVTGRVATERAKAAADARRGYVLLSEKLAAEAKAAELQRQVSAGNIVIEAYQVQLKNARAAEQAKSEEVEQRISAYEALRKTAGRSCQLDDTDRRFLLDLK